MSPQPPPPFDLATYYTQQQANYTAQAATANALAVEHIKGRWQQQYDANQLAADAGQPMAPYDPAPQKQVVSFRNGAFQTDLVPFPDLTPPPLPTARPVAGGTVIAATPTTPDKLDMILYGIGQILARLPK